MRFTFAIVLGATAGAACAQLAMAGDRPCAPYAKGAKRESVYCKDPEDCPRLALKPSRWNRRHADLHMDAVNVILREWSDLRDSSHRSQSPELGLILEEGSIRVDCALSHRIRQFPDLVKAWAAYHGVVGKDVLFVRKAVARTTAAGYPAVEFVTTSYISPLGGGGWELDWLELGEYVAFRGANGVLHVWMVRSAAT
jgi:hypothetical protein